MAIFVTDRDAPARGGEAITFEHIWRHYRATGTLYPAKEQHLEPIVAQIADGFPRLLAAPADVFQFHAIRVGGQIVSSLCVFHDSDETIVPTHATSRNQPSAMIACIRSMFAVITPELRTRYAVFYFRPENRWTSRIAQRFNDVHPPHLRADVVLRDYLVCRPRVATESPDPRTTDPIVPEIDELVAVAHAGIGPLRTAALGIGRQAIGMPDLRDRFARIGVRRQRVLLAARRDGALAGFALSYIGDVPMNFSFLCSRVEVIVHPEAPDRAGIVTELASGAAAVAAQHGLTICPLLIGSTDVPAAEAAGFRATGRHYATGIWEREGEEGWPRLEGAFEALYEGATRSRHGVIDVQPALRTG